MSAGTGARRRTRRHNAEAQWRAVHHRQKAIYRTLIIVDAATLTITGSAAGHGICNLTVEADIISANVSQAINCSSWQIVAGGLA